MTTDLETKAAASKTTRAGVELSQGEARLIKHALYEGWGTSCVVSEALKKVYGTKDMALAAADEIMREVFADVQPRGQVERLLCEQLVMLHGQAQLAHALAINAPGWEVRDRALNSASRLLADFRKTLGALQAHRNPPRQVIHAKQLNQAGQQVVVNGDVTPNELGAEDA